MCPLADLVHTRMQTLAKVWPALDSDFCRSHCRSNYDIEAQALQNDVIWGLGFTFFSAYSQKANFDLLKNLLASL